MTRVATDHLFGGLPQHTLFRFADDLVVAIALGCVALFYERRRRRYLANRLQIIREMNHHIRNALQVISFTALQQENEKARSMMRDSVTRIDWALREVLPVETDGEGDRQPQIVNYRGRIGDAGVNPRQVRCAALRSESSIETHRRRGDRDRHD